MTLTDKIKEILVGRYDSIEIYDYKSPISFSINYYGSDASVPGLKGLMAFAELFGTMEINVENGDSCDGCDTCGYGSYNGFVISILNPTKNVEEMKKLVGTLV